MRELFEGQYKKMEELSQEADTLHQSMLEIQGELTSFRQGLPEDSIHWSKSQHQKFSRLASEMESLKDEKNRIYQQISQHCDEFIEEMLGAIRGTPYRFESTYAPSSEIDTHQRVTEAARQLHLFHREFQGIILMDEGKKLDELKTDLLVTTQIRNILRGKYDHVEALPVTHEVTGAIELNRIRTELSSAHRALEKKQEVVHGIEALVEKLKGRVFRATHSYALSTLKTELDSLCEQYRKLDPEHARYTIDSNKIESEVTKLITKTVKAMNLPASEVVTPVMIDLLKEHWGIQRETTPASVEDIMEAKLPEKLSEVLEGSSYASLEQERTELQEKGKALLQQAEHAYQFLDKEKNVRQSDIDAFMQDFLEESRSPSDFYSMSGAMASMGFVLGVQEEIEEEMAPYALDVEWVGGDEDDMPDLIVPGAEDVSAASVEEEVQEYVTGGFFNQDLPYGHAMPPGLEESLKSLRGRSRSASVTSMLGAAKTEKPQEALKRRAIEVLQERVLDLQNQYFAIKPKLRSRIEALERKDSPEKASQPVIDEPTREDLTERLDQVSLEALRQVRDNWTAPEREDRVLIKVLRIWQDSGPNLSEITLLPSQITSCMSMYQKILQLAQQVDNHTMDAHLASKEMQVILDKDGGGLPIEVKAYMHGLAAAVPTVLTGVADFMQEDSELLSFIKRIGTQQVLNLITTGLYSAKNKYANSESGKYFAIERGDESVSIVLHSKKQGEKEKTYPVDIQIEMKSADCVECTFSGTNNDGGSVSKTFSGIDIAAAVRAGLSEFGPLLDPDVSDSMQHSR